MARQQKTIYLKQWMFFHPYIKPVQSDYYYFEICKKARKVITAPKHDEITSRFTDDELNKMCCFLVCYFEDVISSIGIWRSFTKKHIDLYDKYLPFFQLDEYYPDEINPEDIFFLIWYYLSNTFYGKKTFSPVSKNIILLGLDIYRIFDEEYEYAPENNILKEFLSLPPREDDYYKVRSKIEWVILDSYLFYFNRNKCKNEISELSESKKNIEFFHKNIETFAKEIIDSYVVGKTTPFLALRGKDWLAGILGEDHPLYNDILNISKRKTGFYLYQKYDEDYVYVKHLATDTVLRVTKKSLDVHPDFKEDETILLISFVKWKNDWWFSGTYSLYPYNADLILDEKNSVKSRALFGGDDDKKRKELQIQYDLFMKYNNNRALVFTRNKREVEKIIHGFYDLFNESLKLSKKEIENAQKRRKKKGFFGTGTKIDFEIDDMPGIVYFNPRSGIEILFGYNGIIPDPQNPHYEESVDRDEVLQLLYSKQCSSDLVKYLIENYHLPGIKFPGERDENILVDNLDFMLRFWKNNSYYSEPGITFI